MSTQPGSPERDTSVGRELPPDPIQRDDRNHPRSGQYDMRPREQASEWSPTPTSTLPDATPSAAEPVDNRGWMRRHPFASGLVAATLVAAVAVPSAVANRNAADRDPADPGTRPVPTATSETPSEPQNTTGSRPNIPGVMGEVEPLGKIDTDKIYPGDVIEARWSAETVLRVNYLQMPGGEISTQDSMNMCYRAFEVLLTLPDAEFERVLPSFTTEPVVQDAFRFLRTMFEFYRPGNTFLVFDTQQNQSGTKLVPQPQLPGTVALIETAGETVNGIVFGHNTIEEANNGGGIQPAVRLRILSEPYLAAHPDEDLGSLSAVWKESWGLTNVWFWLESDGQGHARIHGFNMTIRQPGNIYGPESEITIYTPGESRE